ncbi:TetR family transcriptional regulator [Flavobacterium sp. NST-5]|uniref:TetR family transcriptional regulator n=1 Tax=Flavobacterium ichthyis TaxID=2698827 RepID=A0ABW9ZA14_9FLAO|nr:TetR/AcrR family transcriptional regulator [Flavobacterium ichthyis]NBL63643.1 TetR family transcriptional regulator [Flavobacterium ichthyis]
MHTKENISNKNVFLKDPETSVLGKKIIGSSIEMIDEIGFENFTFKKLGEKINSNESSIYRYFENKHKLMLYLSSWYWEWIEKKMLAATQHFSTSKEKLEQAIIVVTEKIEDDGNTPYVNESILNKIIIQEFTKTLFTKEVDEENKKGFFMIYKRVINHITDLISEVNPNYRYAKSLASTVVEGSLHQHFLKEHFKTITNCNNEISPTDFYLTLIEKTLEKS